MTTHTRSGWMTAEEMIEESYELEQLGPNRVETSESARLFAAAVLFLVVLFIGFVMFLRYWDAIVPSTNAIVTKAGTVTNR
jgi:formate hydrogenlyase subunit 4